MRQPARHSAGLRVHGGLSRRFRVMLIILGLAVVTLVTFTRTVLDPNLIHEDGRKLAGRVLKSHEHSMAHSMEKDGHMKASANSPKQAPEEPAGPPPALRLMLSSHGRLMWYYPGNDTVHVLHEGEGVHYGVFPGDTRHGSLHSVWVVVRPHNWHPTTSEEHLLELEADTGRELRRVRLPSRFTHDAVRAGNRVYVCNTEQGAVLELAYPSMEKAREMRLFTLKQHINTLAPLEPGSLWAVLHNLGKSELVEIDTSGSGSGGARVVRHIPGVGTKAHGLVSTHRGSFIMLDSEGGALVEVERGTGGVTRLWKVPEGGKFLKGLAVVDGVAYFGVSVWSHRSDRDDPQANSELAAFDLYTRKLLWRRKVPTRGLLNIVAAPQLGEGSTYRVMSTWAAGQGAVATATEQEEQEEDAGEQQRTLEETLGESSSSSRSGTDGSGRQGRDDSARSSSRGSNEGLVDVSGAADGAAGAAGPQRAADEKGSEVEIQRVTRQLEKMGFPPKLGGRWSTGLPYLHLETKKGSRSWEAGIQLPLTHVDVSRVQARLRSLPPDIWDPGYQRIHNAVVDGRQSNMDKFKPGCDSMYLVFSDRSTDHAYRYPYYEYFQDVVEPIIKQVVGEDGLKKIVRLQLARMPPHGVIKMHRDMGGYAMKGHRIHVPVETTKNVSFELCPKLEQRKSAAHFHGEVTDHDAKPGDCVSIPMARGMVFEVNNRVLHRVFNPSDTPRVHLVVDVGEVVKPTTVLAPGTVCNYVQATIVCPDQAAARGKGANAALS